MNQQIQNVRTLEVIEAELDLLERDTRQKETALLGNYIEVGRRLEEVKAMLKHGQWGDWLEKRGYSQSTANKLMRVFREYGASQQSLFGGEANSPALANLSLTKALRLLSLPDQEEREKFVEENDVENMTTRELEQAIRERDEALKVAEEAKADARTAEDSRAKMEADMKVLNECYQASQAAVSNAYEELEQARAELEELKNKPVDVAVMSVDQEKLDQDRAEAVAEMQAKVDKAVKARDEAEKKRKAAEAALADANAKLEAAVKVEKKSVISGDPDLAEFGFLLRQADEIVNKLHGIRIKVRGREDPSAAENLARALLALSEKLKEAAQ